MHTFAKTLPRACMEKKRTTQKNISNADFLIAVLIQRRF
jgi:hypothetical protein